MHGCGAAPPLSLTTLESPALSVLSASWGFKLGPQVLPTQVHPNIIPFLSAVDLSARWVWLPKVERFGMWLRGNNTQIEDRGLAVPEQSLYLSDLSAALPSLRRECIETKRPTCSPHVSREGSSFLE